tara:strand:+ start:5411 stop:9850 length:4440 start_codon:yes stop_codon:yes gene_type:complete
MHLLATKFRVDAIGESWKDASNRIEVRFENIDVNILSRFNPYEYDAFWCKLSDHSSSVWYSSLDSYKTLVEKHKKRKKPRASGSNDQDDQALADAEDDTPPDPWDPPRKFDVPTHINFNDQATRSRLRNFIDDGGIDMQAFDDFISNASLDNFCMSGFPQSLMCASIELSLFKPFSNKYVGWDMWLNAKNVELPPQISVRLLLLKNKKNSENFGNVDSSISAYTSAENDLPRDCFSMEDYRQHLRAGKPKNLTRPLKGRCLEIYKMQWDAVTKIRDPSKRVSYIYDRYLRNTVLPLVEVNIKSDDTGEMGGSDPRLAICSELASMSSSDPNKGYRCRAVHTFREGLKNMLLNSNGAVDIIKRFRGSLASSEGCLYLMHELTNLNGNLKPDNQRIRFLFADSDCGFFLDGLSSFFEMAPNFIGLPLWCQNFNGCAGTREKTRGTGVDEAVNQHIAGYTPMVTDPNSGVDYSGWLEQGETKGVSETALFSKYSTTITKNGEVQSAVTVNQPNVVITEPIYNNQGQNENLARISTNVPRNYSSASYGKRDVTVQNKDGSWVNSEQHLIMLMRLIMMAENSNNRSHFAMTLESVVQVCAAGAVDQEDFQGRKRARGLDARSQMGMQQRFYGKRQIPWVTSVANMLGRDVTTVSNHAAFVHGSAFFGHRGEKKVKSGTETTWQDICISVVHKHQCMMNSRASCPQNWPRITEMARTRSVPYGLRLHATNSLLHHSAKNKTWHDIQESTIVNFLADPVPAQTLPVFLASLLYSSMDWLLFVVMGAFAKYFDVPAIDPQIMERVYADPDYIVPDAAAKPMRRWLERVGIGGAGAGSSGFEPMVAPFDSTAMEKSVLYVTTAYEDGGDFAEGSLTANIEPPKSSNFSDDTKAVSNTDRMCTAVAKVLVKLYASHFRGACNIGDSEQGNYKAFKPIADCLVEYSKKPIHFHRFGAIPSGRGFCSFKSICRAFGLSSSFSGGGFMDAAVDTENYMGTPFMVRQASGNIYRFGADPRWLMYYKCVVGRRACISQSSGHALLHHWTEQFVMHRVPELLCPSNYIFSSMTSSEAGGFAYTKLPEHKRPRTFLRPTPDSIVLDANSKVCCGLLSGLRMPEDCYMAEPAARLASSVSDDQCSVGINDVVLPSLRSPTIPVSQFIYCEVRFEYNSDSEVARKTYPAVVFSEQSVNGELYVDKNMDTTCEKVTRLDQNGALQHTSSGCAKISPVQRTLETVCSGDIGTVTSHTKDMYIHWQNVYARPGVLLEIEIEQGCTVYGVLKEWLRDDVDCVHRYFNPSTMGYLCVLNAAESESAMWPADPPFELADYQPLFQHQEMFWNVPGCCVDDLLVSIGRVLYLDASSADARKLIQGDISLIGFLDSPKVTVSNTHRGASLDKFLSCDSVLSANQNQKLLPVIRVTLVYEMPSEVLSVSDDNADGLGVYVGFHVENQKGKRHVSANIQYALVQPRSLITESRLSLMNTEPVFFAFFE